MAIFSKLDRGSMLFFRGYDMVVLASRRSANMSKIRAFAPSQSPKKVVSKWGSMGISPVMAIFSKLDR